ncbi:DUF3667 domain-containing protein [Hymenobacter weizhouensis]|uniref:DUF3667 domain-containing protein n=1 Tax=Hymenobacter sp. YIM 151500-1 TaxID=2987689 RepID=UPI00222794E2|nr:DUF3667 domain-containing protein [Hymenobacter sp. YIM 151500-1]UYZ63552.1 DUF3667 domain-containing protein [Hymenobacter sp. YIM 151500-1]
METSVAPTSPAASAHAAECLNCGHAVPDRYCGRCGQDAHHTHRLTLKDMPHDVLHSIWHVDKGILYTLKTMVRRPGPTIRAYLAGQRVDHFRPLSLLFIVTGLYALLSAVLHISFLPPKDPTVPDAVWQMQQIFTTFFMKYLSWCYVAMVPVWALFARWFLRRGGYNYAECLIIAAFIIAICNFFALLYLPVMYIYSGTPQIGTVSMVFMLPVFAYTTWAYGSLLTHTGLSLAGRLWRGFMTYTLGYLTCIFMVVALTYALNWSTFKAALQQQAKLKMERTAPSAGR